MFVDGLCTLAVQCEEFCDSCAHNPPHTSPGTNHEVLLIRQGLRNLFQKVSKFETGVAGDFNPATICKREVKVKGIIKLADSTCGVSQQDMFTSIEE
jgi:hypothetical protein